MLPKAPISWLVLLLSLRVLTNRVSNQCRLFGLLLINFVIHVVKFRTAVLYPPAILPETVADCERPLQVFINCYLTCKLFGELSPLLFVEKSTTSQKLWPGDCLNN